MAANRATNYSYENCSFCIINNFEIRSTDMDTPKYQISHPCLGIYDDDDRDNEMFM